MTMPLEQNRVYLSQRREAVSRDAERIGIDYAIVSQPSRCVVVGAHTVLHPRRANGQQADPACRTPPARSRSASPGCRS